MRHPLHLIFLALVVMAAGCYGVPVRTVTITRTLEQSALAPAPQAPRTAGAPLRSGQLALEGGMTFATPLDAERTRYQSSNGEKYPSANIYNDKTIHGRIAGAPNKYIELGWALNYAHLSWGTVQAAADTDPGEVESEMSSFWQTGPHIRVMPLSEPEGGFGMLFEFEFANTAYTRNIYEKATVTEYQGGLPEKTQFLGQRIKTQSSTTLYPIVRFGLFGFGRVGDVTLAGGGAVQNAPVYFGVKRADFQCTYYDTGTVGPDGTPYPPDGQADYQRCQGIENPDDVDPYESVAVFNLFFTVAYTLGPVTLQGQVSGNLSSNDALGVIPVMLDFSARYAFELGDPEPEPRPVYKGNDRDGYHRGY